jgi:PAS domain S-box-containing protein
MRSVSGPGERPGGPVLEDLHQRAAQADNLRAVQEVAVAVTAVHESSVIAALAAEKACQLVGGDGADLSWWDDEADLLTPLAGHRTSTTYQTRPSGANQGAIGEAFSRREPVLVSDYQAWPQALPWIRAAGVQSVVAVPLMVRDQVLGALAVNSHRPHAFQSDQVELLSRLASLVTPDLEAAHMLESRDLQVRGLTALQEVAVAASGMLDAEALARLTVDRATALLGVDSAVLRWWDERAGELRLLASNDRNPTRHGPAIGPDRGVIGRAFREGRAVTIGDYGHSEVSLPGVAQDGVMTAVAVPLTVGDRTVGALAVATYKPHRYDALQSRLLSLFAAQVAPAIEAARLAAERERHHLVMSTLQNLGAAAGGLLDFAVISQMAIDAVVELLGASSAGIGWWDPEAAALTGVADHLKDPAAQAVARDEGILGQVFATGRAVVVPDYPDWEHRLEWSVALGHKSLLAVPLLLQDRTVGTLIARFKERRGFDGDELQVLALIASSMAPMLEAARLHGDLAASERSLRVLHGVMACGVEVIDNQGRILEMNGSALAMFGLRRDQLDGRMPAEIAGFQRITEEGIPLAWDQRPVAVAMRTRKPVRGAVVGYRRGNGTEFWLQFDCVPMLDAGGRVEQVIGTFIDITSVKVAETVRRESEAKSRFLATMSHELRTPLNSILGFAQLLDGEAYGDLNERQRRYLGHISTSGRHLLALVNDVLDLSKVAAGQMELAIERLEVDPLIHEVVERLRPMADARQLGVTVDATPGLALRADRRRLEQVLANLVSNAIKFTPAKGSVAIQVRGRRKLVEVSVRDSGIGIPPEQHERIFMEFTQVEDGLSRRHEGTGLGLPLSRRLVELMGGRIWLKSDPGGGSEFSFTLPSA